MYKHLFLKSYSYNFKENETMLQKKLDELNKELFETKEENEQLTLARADLENEKVLYF